MKPFPSGVILLAASLCFLNFRSAAQSIYATPYTFTTFAGSAGYGSADGIGSHARFYWPWGIAVSTTGTVYVADSYNNTIRKITPAGVVSTLAGLAGYEGHADGTGGNARFSSPQGVSVDSAGNVYVADTGNHTIRKITSEGLVSTLCGLAGSSGSADGDPGEARFNQPTAVAVDTEGNVFVADSDNHTIRRITPLGTVETIAGLAGWYGTADGTGSAARFNGPSSVAVDAGGNVYVADTGNHTIRKVTPADVVSTLAGLAGGSGSADGLGANARFYLPYGVALGSDGNVYAADSWNHTIRRITPAGLVSTLAGLAGYYGSDDLTGQAARFAYPYGVAADTAGNLYVADTGNNTIRKVTAAGLVSTVAGAKGSGSTDGTGTDARFAWPNAVTVDGAGNLYVADNWSCTIRKITSAGVVSTLAGFAGWYGINDGVGSEARFQFPGDVAVDSGGNVIVADTSNHTVRRITPAGLVTTWVGYPGYGGAADGTGYNALFYYPSGVTADGAGNVYVADTYNCTVRKVTASGVVSTLAGLAGWWGSNDGTGSSARFNTPCGVAADTTGNVYVADTGNNTIRKITSGGVVSTLAGLAGFEGSTDGTGSSARFRSPRGIAVDSAGNLYVADTDNYTIRKVTSAGVVSTLAGLATFRGSSDGAAGDARFNEPGDVAVDSSGALYVADSRNNTIRKGVLTAYAANNPVPYSQPPMNGRLVMTLLPPEANGQWRFTWELGWHSSGEVVSNLVAGNYPIEFRDTPGWLPYPPMVTAAVTNALTTLVTNQYYPTFNLLGTTNTGALAVNIGPSTPSGAAWRFLGETTWRGPGSVVGNLLPDTYAIEFKPVSGYSKPATQAVRVTSATIASVWASYLLAQAPPAGVELPVPVATNAISDLATYPYGFNGQLQTDVGYGSGVAVQSNVVLTAAHLVFNDETLSYVKHVYWRFRQETGVFSPEAQAARGWYILGGYAVQRTNDVLGGLGADRSSPQSRNLDVAALYFPTPVAGGGHGGYLPSEAVPNSWLASTSQKMLVGYPVDGSSLGDASIVPGMMYQTGPRPYPLTLATDPVENQQQVYLASWFLSYPGNSGGPLYVQFNGYYYPAGVYLGTLYNGIVPYASLVRGIDSNVVNLITWAQALGDSGTNGTGGGVITITVGAGGSGTRAYLQVNLGPPAAVSQGAAWRLQGTTTNWCGNSPFTVTVPQGGSATLEFKPIPGWDLPPSQALSLTNGYLTTASASYTRIGTWLSGLRLMPNGALAMTLDGTPGGVYAILGSSNLLTPLANWTEVLRVTNTTGQTTFTNPPPAVMPQYYRARQ